MWNVHRESRNTRNSRNWFRNKTFYYLFEFKGFSTWGERDTIFLCWLLLHHQLSIQPMCGTLSAQSRLASSRSESQLTAFFQIPPNPQRFRAWCQSRPRSYFLSGVFIVTSLFVTSTPHVHEHLHSTNPCTKRKVLSLTKLKGKIYKTKNDNIKKSLCNYITF